MSRIAQTIHNANGYGWFQSRNFTDRETAVVIARALGAEYEVLT